MAVRITLRDHTGNIRQPAKVDETASVGQLTHAIVTALKLPVTDPAGKPITYHLAYKNRRLQLDTTLAAATIKEDDNLTIIPELIADEPGTALLHMDEYSEISLQNL